MTKSTKTHHYTYIIRHVNGRYYVGRRSTKKDSLLDPYMGSGDWVKSIKDRSTLTKTIIAYYDTYADLKIAEFELIEKYFGDVYCMNVAYSSCGYASGDKHPQFGKTGELSHNYGRIASEKTRKLWSDARSGENNPCYGRTGDKHPMFGKVGELNPLFGRKHTEQTKQLMSIQRSGEKSCKATITEAVARMIKIRIAEGLKDRPIAEEYNTTSKVVNHIRHKRSWKHVTI